jgi:hypothetical protein
MTAVALILMINGVGLLIVAILGGIIWWYGRHQEPH